MTAKSVVIVIQRTVLVLYCQHYFVNYITHHNNNYIDEFPVLYTQCIYYSNAVHDLIVKWVNAI